MLYVNTENAGACWFELWSETEELPKKEQLASDKIHSSVVN